MAKSFIDVVQDSPRTRLGINVKTKKTLSRTNTPPAEPPFGFELHGRLVMAYGHVRLFRRPFERPPPFLPLAHTLGLTGGVGPDAISTGPPRCFSPDAHRALSPSSQVLPGT